MKGSVFGMSKLVKTSALVLSSWKYGESSLIVRMFTEKLGLRSYLVHGVRSRRTKSHKAALYQPLHWLDIVAYEHPQHTLHHIAEARFLKSYRSIPFNHHKTLIAIFLADFLGHVLKEEAPNEPLFFFLQESLFFLDETADSFADFHLQLLLKVPFYLGFGIEKIQAICQEIPLWRGLSEYQVNILQTLLERPLGYQTTLNGQARSYFLELLLMFYQHHIENMGEIRSLSILKELQ